MRCGLNELGYQVTKTGKVVYKRRSRPFTLKQIIRIFDRSFKPWWDESGAGERMDATGFFSAERTSRADLTRNFTDFIEASTRVSGEFAKIAIYFYDQGPNIAEFITPSRVGIGSMIKNLIKIWEIFLKLMEGS